MHVEWPAAVEAALSPARTLAHDEAETYPEEAHRLLAEWGVTDHLIPLGQGGRWRSVEELLGLLRAVARRDPTVAFGFGPSLLGALPVWIAGTAEQRARATRLVRGGGVALANTERAHGSDLLANQTRAEPCPGGYRLTGEKWLISNAARADAWTVYARTGETAGPRGHTLFLVEKAALDPAAWALLPRVPTLGLRGGDLGGLRFRDCFVPASARVGEPGSAFDLVHRTLAVTRTLCAGLSLGAADAALRLVVAFADGRRLFGRSVAELPVPRSLLVGAFVDLLLAEVVAGVACRAVQAGRAPLFFSALAKYWVPVRVEQIFRDLSVVLGARFYLRSGHAGALFQKLLRDAAIVSTFEGNTLVHLSLLAGQLARLPDETPVAADEAFEDLLAAGREQPPLDPAGLRVRWRDEDAGLLALVDPTTRRCQRWRRRWARHRGEWTGRGGTLSPRVAGLVREYLDLYVAGLAGRFWRANRDRLGRFFRRGDWLRVGRRRLLAPASVSPEETEGRIARELSRRCADGYPSCQTWSTAKLPG